jgi:hypothetical protein
MIKQNTNQNEKNSKFDDVMGGVIIALYIAGFVMFARYIIKSMSSMAQRNNEKQKQIAPIAPKKALNVANFVDFSRER